MTRHVLAPALVRSVVETEVGNDDAGPDEDVSGLDVAESTDVLPTVSARVPPERVPAADEPAAAAAEPDPGDGGRDDGDDPDPGEDDEAFEAATESPDRPVRTRLQEKRRRRRHRTLLATRAAVFALAMMVVLTIGGAWGGLAFYDDRFDEVSALDPGSPAIQDAPGQHGDSNFLIIGSDTREGLDAEEGHGTDEDVAGSRADTIMLAHVPASEDRAVFVSFPRDLEVELDGCEQWDDKAREYSAETVREAEQVKLAEAYSVGGPRCVTKVIQSISGLRVNHFVGIDFLGFTDMVNAVGGVPVTVQEPVVDEVLGVVVDEPGTHSLSGRQALDFVRARHVQGDPTSDYGRMQRQQQFISALLDSAVSRDVILDPRKMKRFVTAFTNATFGDNVAMDDMLTLAHSLKSTGVESIDFITVPTTGFSNARGNEVLLEGEAGELFAALIGKEPLPGTDS